MLDDVVIKCQPVLVNIAFILSAHTEGMSVQVFALRRRKNCEMASARCVGHARCAAVASEIVALDDNGMNVTAEREVPPKHEKLARRAARACPEGIVSIIEV